MVSNTYVIWGLITLFISIFVILLYIFYYTIGEEGFTQAEIRRSITFTFVIMYIVFLCLSLVPSDNAILKFDKSNEFINNFHTAILLILAFYFGTRAFEVGMSAKRGNVREWAKNIFSKYFDIKNTDDIKDIKELKNALVKEIEKVDFDNPEKVTAEDRAKLKKLKDVLKDIINSG